MDFVLQDDHRGHDTVELADPYGLFRSRALSAPHAGPRLVLNLAPSPADEAGTRARHVAFAVEDMVAAVRRSRAAGAGLLQVPANYYDDLRARYEFREGEWETYRELGILYDRDENGGEFRHCYTQTVGHVFFEFVQRSGGYRGYGAANAPYVRPPSGGSAQGGRTYGGLDCRLLDGDGAIA